MSDMEQVVAAIETEVKHLVKSVEEINTFLKDKAVTKDEFAPVKFVVYGLVATILTSFIGAMITLIVR